MIRLKWKCKVKIYLSILFNLRRFRYNGVTIQNYVCDSGKFPYSKAKTRGKARNRVHIKIMDRNIYFTDSKHIFHLYELSIYRKL